MRSEIPSTSEAWQALCNDLSLLAARGLLGVTSLVDDEPCHVRQKSSDPISNSRPCCPTATAHALIALIEMGISFKPPGAKQVTNRTRFPSFKTTSDIPLGSFPNLRSETHTPTSLVSHLLEQGMDNGADLDEYLAKASHATFPKEDGFRKKWNNLASNATSKKIDSKAWAQKLLCTSTHSGDNPSDEPPYLSEIIFISHMLHAFENYLGSTEVGESQKIKPLIVDGCTWLLARLLLVLENLKSQIDNDIVSGDFSPVLEIPAYAVFLSSSALRTASRLQHRFRPRTGKPDHPITLLKGSVYDYKQLISHWADRQLHRMMSRRGIQGDSEFDVATLVFSMRSRQLCDAKPLPYNFFRECIQEIANSQLRNACWPEGYATDVKGWNVGPQPSVEIALSLAASVFNRDFLVGAKNSDISIAEIALKPLLQFCDFLQNTYIDTSATDPEFPDEDPPPHGWSNDRVRSRRVVDLWPTCLGARFVHLTYLIARGCGRHSVISKYSSLSSIRTIGTSKDRTFPGIFRDSVVEVDQVTQPVGRIARYFLEPLQKQYENKKYFLRTQDGATSFILFGPPGSGKTHILRSISESLGWPLVELSPGDFLKDGSESIEHSASRIFKDLESLFHAVILFDECDELFRQRPKNANARNIFSFVTASMLPKLQRLHDNGSVLFIVATNYVESIDNAVKREGRFDDILLLDRPDAVARAAIIEKISGRAIEEDIQGKLCAATAGLGYAGIRRAVDRYREHVELPDPDTCKDDRRDYIDWWHNTGKPACSSAKMGSKLDKILERLRAEMPEFDECEPQDLIKETD